MRVTPTAALNGIQAIGFLAGYEVIGDTIKAEINHTEGQRRRLAIEPKAANKNATKALRAMAAFP